MPAPVDITDPFRALSDPTRREIVDLLAAGPLPVRMIAGHFPSISRPAVSKHLRILREGRLVEERRSGRERYYSLNPPVLESTAAWLRAVEARAKGPRRGGRPARKARPRRSEAAIRATESVAPARRESAAHRTRAPKARPKRPAASKPSAAPIPEPDDWKAW